MVQGPNNILLCITTPVKIKELFKNAPRRLQLNLYSRRILFSLVENVLWSLSYGLVVGYTKPKRFVDIPYLADNFHAMHLSFCVAQEDKNFGAGLLGSYLPDLIPRVIFSKVSENLPAPSKNTRTMMSRFGYRYQGLHEFAGKEI